MSGLREPGPTCGESAGIMSLADGTAARCLMPTPAAQSWLRPVPATAPPALMCTPQVPDVSYLFNSCRQPRRGLTAEALAAAALELGVELQAMQAVAQVESEGHAFDRNGRPKILYERHVFHRLTGGAHAMAGAFISWPTRGDYNRGGSQYEKLEKAFQLNAWAALQSASWGGFQIMGEYYADAGFASPQHMVQAMAESEDAHLRAFVGYMLANRHVLLALRRKQWTAFARGFNGPDYASNHYDTRMKAAYDDLVADETAGEP